MPDREGDAAEAGDLLAAVARGAPAQGHGEGVDEAAATGQGVEGQADGLDVSGMKKLNEGIGALPRVISHLSRRESDWFVQREHGDIVVEPVGPEVWVSDIFEDPKLLTVPV